MGGSVKEVCMNLVKVRVSTCPQENTEYVSLEHQHMGFWVPRIEHLRHRVALEVISAPQSTHLFSPGEGTCTFGHEDASLASIEARTATFAYRQGKGSTPFNCTYFMESYFLQIDP